MGRPRLIIVIRHAQSEGNKNRDIHQTVPDHRVKLTPEGWQQAYDAGRRLRAMLRPDDTLHFFTSPYRRTRETTEGILATLTSDDPEPSPFKRENIKVYEEPRLREQDFGNFQPCSAEMERMWQERADYGHFFYRIPNGESAADAYDRISGFNESLWRQFGEDDFASVCVLVTHGLMSRVFLMKWYHFSVEHFEDLRNINHCEFIIMRRNDQGKYILENKLRTWSELKRERAAQLAKQMGKDIKDIATLTRTNTGEVRRRWGGCPNGCNHDKNFRVRQTLADLVKADHQLANSATGLANNESNSNSTNGTPGSSSTNGTNGVIVGTANPSFNGTANAQPPPLIVRRSATKRLQSQDENDEDQAKGANSTGPTIDIDKARDEIVSSPDATPSYISLDDRLRSRLKSPNYPPPPASLNSIHLHVGRDFGGTYSGHSDDGDDLEQSSDEDNATRSHGAPMNQSPSANNASATSTTTVTTTSTTTITTSAPVATAIPNGSSSSSSSASVSQSATPRPRLGGTGTNSATSTPTTSTSATSTLPIHPARPQHVHHHHHLHASTDSSDRPPSRMGRGMRANRLGDHLSSDGEHEADQSSEGDACSVCGADGDDERENSGKKKIGKKKVAATAAGTGAGAAVTAPATTGEKLDAAPSAAGSTNTASAAVPVGTTAAAVGGGGGAAATAALANTLEFDDEEPVINPTPPKPAKTLPPTAIPTEEETQELADEADEVLLLEDEREEKTVMGSVF